MQSTQETRNSSGSSVSKDNPTRETNESCVTMRDFIAVRKPAVVDIIQESSGLTVKHCDIAVLWNEVERRYAAKSVTGICNKILWDCRTSARKLCQF